MQTEIYDEANNHFTQFSTSPITHRTFVIQTAEILQGLASIPKCDENDYGSYNAEFVTKNSWSVLYAFRLYCWSDQPFGSAIMVVML